MNFIISTIAAGFFAGPGAHALTLPNLAALNPVDCMTLSVSGLGIDLGAEGLSSAPGGTSELSMTLTLKSGKLIRVSF